MKHSNSSSGFEGRIAVPRSAIASRILEVIHLRRETIGKKMVLMPTLWRRSLKGINDLTALGYSGVLPSNGTDKQNSTLGRRYFAEKLVTLARKSGETISGIDSIETDLIRKAIKVDLHGEEKRGMATSHLTRTLKCGMPTLDGLFKSPNPDRTYSGHRIISPDFNENGITYPSEAASSVCLIGPDGVGKSVLSLHLAWRYLAENFGNRTSPAVFYVSTDLNEDIARRMWANFGLDQPSNDRDPFSTGSGVADAPPIDLHACSPNSIAQRIDLRTSNRSQFCESGGEYGGR
ncbi:MAG: AAA family ATPase [Acidobacteria bacterium]|nr:AAA family ATPase [Acidobacteriota bacterium]